MRFISSRRVCRCPSAGRLFFRESSRNEVHCWIRLPSTNTSTIYQREWREERGQERAREGGAGRRSTYHGRKVKILGMTFCIHLYEAYKGLKQPSLGWVFRSTGLLARCSSSALLTRCATGTQLNLKSIRGGFLVEMGRG